MRQWIMVETAIKLCLKQMAITDHYDPDYPDPNFGLDLNPTTMKWKLKRLNTAIK